jgi:hypothetical protein
MEKTFQYQQQIFAGLELEIYNDLLKNDEIFLQCSLAGRRGGWGVNILEDERNRIALLQ